MNETMNERGSMKWIMISQSVMMLGAGIVFPFYIIFMREVGGDFTEFGIAYGLFILCSAYLNRLFGKSSDRYGRKGFLVISAWGTSLLFLLVPIVTSIWHIYVLQICMGVFGAMQKTCEKAMIADMTEGKNRGEMIGKYHFAISLFSGMAVIVGGFLIDFFTLDIIFYLGSIMLFVSGLLLMKVKK